MKRCKSLAILLLVSLFCIPSIAVEAKKMDVYELIAMEGQNSDALMISADTILSMADTLSLHSADTPLMAELDTVRMDSFLHEKSTVVDTVVMPQPMVKRWMPDSKKALWMAIAFPGGGQIYNRKYWKLPIFYGGFLGCFYAYNWNNTMYHDYAQAYIDIMDDDENTNSFTNFLPPNYDYKANASRLQNLFRRKKDFYRRYRDLSLFCVIGVYLLSIVDAYVDAELSSFDISRDLSMKVKPTVINSNRLAQNNRSLMGGSYGVSCSLNF